MNAYKYILFIYMFFGGVPMEDNKKMFKDFSNMIQKI